MTEEKLIIAPPDTDPDPSPKPGAVRLRNYWVRGKGSSKIRWGTSGDYTRCVRLLRKYVGTGAPGLCQVWHKVANGYYTGDRRNKDGNWEAEYKRTFSSDERDKLGKRGQAFRNHNGEWSYPISNEQDLKNAIQAFGRASEEDRERLKAYIKRRAKALGLTNLIPDSWSKKSEELPIQPEEVQFYIKMLLEYSQEHMIVFMDDEEED
jgi:hypothetical protein